MLGMLQPAQYVSASSASTFSSIPSELLYRDSVLQLVCRPQRKQLHAALHSVALICIVGAIAAAISSHNLARPVIPNFYSPHSWLGASTLTVVVAQVTPHIQHCLHLHTPVMVQHDLFMNASPVC